MNITSAKFEISNSNVKKCPATCRHEYAFIGRSNVGKSSLINMLTGHKGLAMTSSTPGKPNSLTISRSLTNCRYHARSQPMNRAEELLPGLKPSFITRRSMPSISCITTP